MRACVPTPGSGGVIEGAALDHVGIVAVIASCFPRVSARRRVAPVCPGAEGESPQRSDPQVVARKRNGAIRELLVIGIAAHRGQPSVTTPGITVVRGYGRPRVERRSSGAADIIPDGQLRRIVGVEPAVPPDGVHNAAISG